MAGDREQGATDRAGHAPQQAGAANASGATSSVTISAVAGAVAGGPSKVAAVLRRFPGQRAAIMAWLQSNCGNAFVQSVLAEPAPVEATAAWDIVATPHSVRFPETEVGAVSAPRTIVLVNRGYAVLEIASLELVLYAGTGEAAQPGEFELIRGQARSLGALETMAVEVVFRPKRALPHIGAHLRGKGPAAHQQVEVVLKATSAAPRAEHADQRELSVAEHDARGLEVAAPSSVEHYGDMLAAVLAARTLTHRAKPGAPADPQLAKLLEPVAKRLNELNDHRGRFAELGAGNIAGQAALDMSESAIRRWLQLAALGGMIHPDDLVIKFRVGAEPIRLLTGERGDAPTLRAFGHASRAVAVGSAALALSPALVALAAEEAALIGFAAQMGTRQVAVWALSNPAAALAASEALIGFGVQIGEDGIGTFWDQLHDPQGCWFVFAQVLMDFMHVKTSMSGHAGEPAARRSPAPDLDAARQRTARVRGVLQHVHDAAASETRRATVVRRTEGDAHAPADAPAAVAHASRSKILQHKPALDAPGGGGRPAAPHDAEPHELPRSKPSVAAHAADTDLRSQLPADLHGISVTRSPALTGTDVVVQYRNGEVHIEAGPLATGRHVGYHVTTARQLLRFKGPLGLARRLVDTARSKLRGTPGYGTSGFEARAEVAKLVEIERDLVTLRGRLEEGAHVVERGRALDTGAVDGELAKVQEQLELESTRLDSYEPGKGFVAARALPEYPVALDSVETTVIDDDPRQFAVEFTARTKEGTTIRLGEGTVKLTPDGEPDGCPEFYLENYTHSQGTDHKVKLYQSVLDQGASAVPLGEGPETALTRYAIDRFIQRYNARFTAVPAALGGELAFENKKNFQVQFAKYLDQGMERSEALRAAAETISFGAHRIAAGYPHMDVDAGDPTGWVPLDRGHGQERRPVPTIIKITARKQ